MLRAPVCGFIFAAGVVNLFGLTRADGPASLALGLTVASASYIFGYRFLGDGHLRLSPGESRCLE